MAKDKHNANIKKEWTISVLDSDNYSEIERICKALGSQIRLNLIKQLTYKPMTVVELAKLNKVTNSTILFHLDLLTAAGVVESRYLPGIKGKAQVFFTNFTQIAFSRVADEKDRTMFFRQEIPVGDYIDVKGSNFGFATSTQSYLFTDSEAYSQPRREALLLWTPCGKVTYAVDNKFCLGGNTVEEIGFSMEICSETSFYRNDWKSDITFAINGVDIATYTSPGDFGGIRGRLNPDWWANENSQYGTLVNVTVTSTGTAINNTAVSKVTLRDLRLDKDNRLTLTVYNKQGSKHLGGFNIFGRGFGNHEQDIVFTAKYTAAQTENKQKTLIT